MIKEHIPYTRDGHEALQVWLPTTILDRVRIRLLDPRLGRVKHGAMRLTVIQALELWLKQQ